MAMHIAILTVDIGTGLAIDAKILGAILHQFGHRVEIYEVRKTQQKFDPPDCSIFLERFHPKWAGRINVLIPNPEFVLRKDESLLKRFEWIGCKTRYAIELMKPIAGDRVIELGWTTLDRFRPSIRRDLDEFLHIAGCSKQKGTEAVLAAWEANPDFPHLTVIDWRSEKAGLQAANVHHIRKRVSEAELVEHINRCGVHVAPSCAEGFGHTINEAMSSGALLMTTDAPPMNENRRECAVLIPPASVRSMGMAKAYDVDAAGVAEGVRKVMAMTHEQRRQMGLAGRAVWEKNRANFIRGVERMAKMIERNLNAAPGVIEAPRSGFGSNQFRA
jgi:glycosyltransferase involved in cell wall biosynthesis